VERNAPSEFSSRTPSAGTTPVSAKSFSIARSDLAPAAKPPGGIVIQIRMKSGAAKPPPGRMISRKGTEFWLTANGA